MPSQPRPRPEPGPTSDRQRDAVAAKDDDVIVMGQVLAPYGIKGWLKIRPFTEAVDGLLQHSQWLVARRERAGEWRRMQLVQGRAHGGALVACLHEIADRSQAEHLVGAQIAIARDELPAPAAGEFYWSELVGLSVVNEQGVVFGVVREVLDTGAHAVLRVAGERERLIPFVDAYVREVDTTGKTIRVDWQPDY